MANIFDPIVQNKNGVNTPTPTIPSKSTNIFSSVVGQRDGTPTYQYQEPAPVQPKPSSGVVEAVKSVGGFLGDIGKGFYNQFAHPSDTEQQVEKNLVPGAHDTGHPLLDKALDIATLPGKTAIKGAIRFIEPALEPYGMDIAQTVGGNQIVQAMHKGEIDQEQGGKVLNDLAVLKKNAPQIVGDTAQAVLSAYFPALIKEVGGADTVLEGVEAGIKSGSVAGLAFGGAQVASGGSRDVTTNAKIFAGSIIAGLTLGAGTGAVSGALHPDIKAVDAKLEDLKGQMKSPEVKSVIEATQQELKNPSPETLRIAQEKGGTSISEIPQAPKNVFSHIFESKQPEIDKSSEITVSKNQVSPDLQPLAEEARKYKSAEEFVKAKTGEYQPPEFFQKEEIARRTEKSLPLSEIDNAKIINEGYKNLTPEVRSKLINTLNDSSVKEIKVYRATQGEGLLPGDYIALDKAHAEQYASRSGGKIIEQIIPKDSLSFNNRAGDFQYTPNGVSSLTDFYNQATKGGGFTPIAGTGETKVRGLSQGVEAKAIENKLTSGFRDLPEYKTINIKEQAQAAADLIAKDPELARRIALGHEQPPSGLLPESVFVAVEERAIKNGDVNTLRELATSSNLSSEATTMGQRLRTLAERNPDSPVRSIQEVADAREKAAAKRFKGKDIIEEKAKVADEIKTQIKKASTKQTWSEFVQSLQC